MKLLLKLLLVMSLQCRKSLEQSSSLIVNQTVFVPNARHLLLQRLPTFHPSGWVLKKRLPSLDPMDLLLIPSWVRLKRFTIRKVLFKRHELWCYLKMFNMMMPSTGGNSTSFPSTSNRISRCKSLHIFRPTIFRKPILT